MTQEVDAIRRQMAQIRREIHEDMQGVVAGAEAATDWRYYVRLYPFAALGAAAVVGFLIVPRKRRSVTKAAVAAAEATAARLGSAVDTAATKVAPTKEKKRGLVGALMAMVLPLAWKAAQGYAMQYAEQWLAQQGILGPQGGDGPQPGPGPSPGPGGGPAPNLGPRPAPRGPRTA